MLSEIPDHGGWGAVLIFGDNRKEISGFNPKTTNNIMEVTAVLEALKQLKFPCDVTIYSDSAYVVNCFNQNWIRSWKKNNWRNSKKEPVKNKELWEELDSELSKHKYKFVKVKGHADNELNNLCDYLATQAIKDNT